MAMEVEYDPVEPIKPLDIDMVNALLKTSSFGKKIIHLAKTPSTNTEAKNLLDEDCTEGTVVVAEVQSRGRGRLERIWYSPPGGLWLSIILKPENIPHERFPLLSLIAGTSVAEVLNDQFELGVDLKWPNDIMYRGQKLGGILTESIFSGTKFMGVVIGIGLNVILDRTQFPREIRSTVTTLGSILTPDTNISREDILVGILTRLEFNYDLISSGNFEKVLDNWKQISSTIGARVKIQLEGDNYIIGNAIRIDGNGALIVCTDGGTEHTVIAGDCIHLNKEK